MLNECHLSVASGGMRRGQGRPGSAAFIAGSSTRRSPEFRRHTKQLEPRVHTVLEFFAQHLPKKTLCMPCIQMIERKA